MEDKDILRAWAKQKRLAMDKADVQAKSDVIQGKFIAQMNWGALKSLHCYQAIESLNEVKTDKIIDYVRSSQPRIRLVVAEKNNERTDSEEAYDLVLVPALAFDGRGYRLGWGGGYYDRFLTGQPKAKKIGLCFQSGFIQAGLLAEPHDIPLDQIITEV